MITAWVIFSTPPGDPWVAPRGGDLGGSFGGGASGFRGASSPDGSRRLRPPLGRSKKRPGISSVNHDGAVSAFLPGPGTAGINRRVTSRPIPPSAALAL